MPEKGSNMSNLLEVNNFSVDIHSEGGVLPVLQDINFSIAKGEFFSLVGESGCGKSVCSMSLTRLMPANITKYKHGEVIFDGKNLLTLPFEEIRKVRGRQISYIFQDPFTSLNPLKKIGEQIIEPYLIHISDNRKQALDKAKFLLDKVGVTDLAERLNSYPSQMSGGLLQRIAIAAALICDPVLLIADEPTSAIDVTVQAQFIDLLLNLKEENDMSVLFISHDMGLVANISDRIAVMYAGNIIETGQTGEIIDSPRHPYTSALIASVPSIRHGERLQSIPGIVPTPINYPDGCHFFNRCSRAMDECRNKPEMKNFSSTHKAGCFLYHD